MAFLLLVFIAIFEKSHVTVLTTTNINLDICDFFVSIATFKNKNLHKNKKKFFDHTVSFSL